MQAIISGHGSIAEEQAMSEGSDKQQEENERTGSLAGLGAGVLAGAAAGSAVFPVVGTFVGAIAGGLVGSQVGKVIGSTALNALGGLLGEAPAAGAGEGQPAAAPETPAGPAVTPNGPTLLNQLERLSQLRAQGAISEDEFKAAKAKLLGL
jgi:phage tail tape-measure protein